MDKLNNDCIININKNNNEYKYSLRSNKNNFMNMDSILNN